MTVELFRKFPDAIYHILINHTTTAGIRKSGITRRKEIKKPGHKPLYFTSASYTECVLSSNSTHRMRSNASGWSFTNCFAALTATSAASSTGSPKTPVEIDGKASILIPITV